jgi:hypothetical protein
VPSPPPPADASQIGEDLQVLDLKMKQLKFEYEQYFMGGRPREPAQLRAEVQKIVTRYSNMGIPNTALRFKFNNLCARYFALRRRWDGVLRQIEEGTYKPQLFKAKMRGGSSATEEAGTPPARRRGAGPPGGDGDLFASYVAARERCGEEVKGLTREKLAQLVEKQSSAIRQRYGCDEVRFRVVVENGRTKLKATPVKATR